jgi:hypothetical protein
MPSYPAYTIYAFGLTALLLGTTNLLFPNTATQGLGLPDECIPASNGMSSFLYVVNVLKIILSLEYM